MTADTLPSRNRPSAIFSLVVSPCASTIMFGVSLRIFVTAASTTRNGLSKIGCMNVRAWTLMTPIFPLAVSKTIDGDFASNTAAARSVLAVDDDEIQRVFRLQVGQPGYYRGTTWLANNIAKKKNR